LQRLAGRGWSAAGGALILVAIVVLVSGAASVPAATQPPQLVMDESVAADFRALALGTWDRFLAVFEERDDCFGDVYLRATRTLGSRAAYDPDSATVTVRVPGTPAMLQGALVHEWAHHVEFQCDEHQDLRRAFLAAQGLPPDTPWRPDNTAINVEGDIPSEQYAEATIVLVLGQRPIPTGVRVTEEMVHVIAEWVAGVGDWKLEVRD